MCVKRKKVETFSFTDDIYSGLNEAHIILQSDFNERYG